MKIIGLIAILIIFCVWSASAFQLQGNWQFIHPTQSNITIYDWNSVNGDQTYAIDMSNCTGRLYFNVYESFLQIIELKNQNSLQCINNAEKYVVSLLTNSNIFYFDIKAESLTLVNLIGTITLPLVRRPAVQLSNLTGIYTINNLSSQIQIDERKIRLCDGNEIEYSKINQKLAYPNSRNINITCKDDSINSFANKLTQGVYYRPLSSPNQLQFYDQQSNKLFQLKYYGPIISNNISNNSNFDQTLSIQSKTQNITQSSNKSQTDKKQNMGFNNSFPNQIIENKKINSSNISIVNLTTNSNINSTSQSNNKTNLSTNLSKPVFVTRVLMNGNYLVTNINNSSSANQQIVIIPTLLTFLGCNKVAFPVIISNNQSIIVRPEIPTIKKACGSIDQPIISYISKMANFTGEIKGQNLTLNIFDSKGNYLFAITRTLQENEKNTLQYINNTKQDISINSNKSINLNTSTQNSKPNTIQNQLKPPQNISNTSNNSVPLNKTTTILSDINLIGQYNPTSIRSIKLPKTLYEQVIFIITVEYIYLKLCQAHMYRYQLISLGTILIKDDQSVSVLSNKDQCDPTDDQLYTNMLGSINKYQINNETTKQIIFMDRNNNKLLTLTKTL